jgi:hypothetical protein
MYVEAGGNFAAAETGSIATGLAVANPSSAPAVIAAELFNPDGVSTGLRGSLRVPASGQVALFVNQIPGLENMPAAFAGTIAITSDRAVSVLGIRGRYNEASNFLMTTLPAISDGSAVISERIFPHLADGQGFTTQFILMDSGTGRSSGTIRFFNQQGQPLALRMQN